MAASAAIGSQDGARHALDVHGHQGDGGGVVVHDQDLARNPVGERKHADVHERFVQLLAGDRLLDHGGGAEREALRRVRHDGDDHHRDAPEIRGLLDAGEELPAVHLRQHDVEDDQREPLLQREDERVLGAGGMHDPEPLRLQLDPDQLRRTARRPPRRGPCARRPPPPPGGGEAEMVTGEISTAGSRPPSREASDIPSGSRTGSQMVTHEPSPTQLSMVMAPP
jgi:hypothetical protein